MKTSRFLCLMRTTFLALVVAGASAVIPAELQAAGSGPTSHRPTTATGTGHTARLEGAVLPAAWYEEILNSRSRTIQAVFILVLIGAFMLRRSS